MFESRETRVHNVMHS